MTNLDHRIILVIAEHSISKISITREETLSILIIKRLVAASLITMEDSLNDSFTLIIAYCPFQLLTSITDI